MMNNRDNQLLLPHRTKESLGPYQPRIAANVLILYDYKIDRVPLAGVTKVEDVNLVSMTTLCIYIVADCKNLGFIFRNIQGFISKQALQALITGLVITKLEHIAVVWNPFYINQKLVIERIQKKYLLVL